MSTFTLPTPEVTTPWSYYDNGKSRNITFYLSPKPEQDGDAADAVQISIYHDKDSKRFTATAYRVVIKKDGGFTSTSFDLFAGLRLKSQPVARFSQKALEAFTAEVLASVEAYVEASERFAAMFAYEPEA